MKKIVNYLKKNNGWKLINVFALSVVIMNAQQCCYWYMHQPEFPVEAEKYRKFR